MPNAKHWRRNIATISSAWYGVNKKVPFAEDDLIQRTISPYTATDFEIVNLGGSAANTLSQLISGIEDILGKKAKINYLPDQPGDVPLTFADVSKAGRLFGYAPGTPLRKGLQRYVEWVKTRLS